MTVTSSVQLEPAEQRIYRLLLAVAVAGVVVRLIVIAVSYGSSDMANWELFAHMLDEDGLWATYRDNRSFNHPPLMALMAIALSKLSTWSTIPFRFTWKLPELAADLFALWLLWRHFAPRGPLWAAAAVAVFSCNPVSIAVSAFHGNTDSLCAVLALFAALLHTRGRFAAAGVALAAAVNVKVIALLLIPGFFLLAVVPRDALRFAFGVALGSLPFVVALLNIPDTFYRNVFAYGSQVDAWGFNAWALRSQSTYPALHRFITVDYRAAGKAIIIALTFALAGIARYRRWHAARLGTATFAMFLFITPGFGVQYLVWIVPLLGVTNLRYSVWWGSLAGGFLILTYDSFLTPEWPLTSIHSIPIREPMSTLGLFAWVMLGRYLHEQLARCSDQSPNTPNTSETTRDEAES
jgi:Glycosyltransferase family 87